MPVNPPPVGAKTVLIVDDDHDILFAIRAAVESRGYRVITASDGNMGLNIAEREKPDLVIVDMMMPKKSGFLVLERLKAKGREWSPKMIMITANEGGRHRAYAEMLGVDEYLRKPFSMDKLLESVKKLVPVERVQAAPSGDGAS
jgi:DNA-binding response OmpR family regulator